MYTEVSMTNVESDIRHRAVLGWLLACIALALVILGAVKHAVFIPTDYETWHADWHAVAQCIAHDGYLPCQGVSKFPPAYLLNAGLAGLQGAQAHRVLSIINAICLFLPIVALLLTQGLGALFRAGWAYVAAIALSPLPVFYVATGALEVQSAIFCGLYIGAFARTLAAPELRPGQATTWLLVVSGLIFPLYKDTIAGFVGVAIIFTLALHWRSLKGLAVSDDGRKRLIKAAVFAVSPVLISQLVVIAYWKFKYGVPLPLAYMEEAAKAAPTLTKSAEFFLGSILSPNGGVIIFWGLPTLVALLGWRAVGLKPRRQVVVAALVLAVICCLAFARWWATFGWDSWGNRLMVPAALAALVASLLCLRPCTQGKGKRASNAFIILCQAPLLACSAYYAFIPYALPTAQLLHNTLWYGPACKRMEEAMVTDAATQGLAFWKSETYYQCARERMLQVPGM